VNFAVHFIRMSSPILSCFSGSFLLYIMLLVAVVKRKKRIVGGGGRGGGNRSVFNNRENSFPYFIYIVVIISI